MLHFFSRNTRARRQHVIFRCQLGNWLSTSPLSFLFFGTFLIITSEMKNHNGPFVGDESVSSVFNS